MGVAADPTTSITSDRALGRAATSSVGMVASLLESNEGGISSVFPGANASY